MADGATATVFLKTSLGTRLAVSFPARATVADLKRQVSAEHAACFPRTGPISVTSLQIKLDGSWFQLTDSMAVQAAFEWVKGPWRLLVEAHELRPRPLARKDAKCGTDVAESNGDHPVIADNSPQCMLPPAEAPGVGNHTSGNVTSDVSKQEQMENQQNKTQEGVEHVSGQHEDGVAMPQESSDIDLASGNCDIPPINQEDKSHEGLEHNSNQFEGGLTTPQEDFDLAAGGSDTTPINQQDKSHQDVEHASGQHKDGITMAQECSDSDLAADDSDTPMNQEDRSPEGDEHVSDQSKNRTDIPQESSDLGVAANKDNAPVGNQQEGIMVEPRGKKRLREEDKANESIFLNCDDHLSSLASSTPNVVSEKKSSVSEQAELNNDLLLYSLEDCSHGLGVNPSGGQKKPGTSGVCNGESSNNGSDIPPCVESMEKLKSSDKELQTQRADTEEPQIAGPAGKISCKRIDVPHCVEFMKEGDKGPAFKVHYLGKGKNGAATSTISKGNEPCFRRSPQRVAVRKVPMSRASKIYAVRF